MYVKIPHHLRDAVTRKHPEKWEQNSWFLQHDNTPAHQLLVGQKYFTKQNMTASKHLPYSPDLSLTDFSFFLFLK
jgi:hypothetical protein